MSPDRLALPLAALAALLPAAVLAATPEAWEEFRADVEKTCAAAVPEKLASPTIFVEPTGTESYGLALIEGLSPEAKTRIVYVCVYDKQGKTAEVSPPVSTEYIHILTNEEREAILERRNAAGDNKTMDESGQE
ncbi:MAG: hypothetical protein QHC90_23725 [Shinella sp.]|nr:hypothetical protein [Shinella sp.]